MSHLLSVESEDTVVIQLESESVAIEVVDESQISVEVSSVSSGGGSSAIDDAILDGVTDRAPSQNAVFDALAGKETAGAGASAVAAHVALPDPHSQYATDSDLSSGLAGKLDNLIATARILGRTSSGSGIIEQLTSAQVTALLDQFTSLFKGLVPASGGGTTNFLRADGTWSAPPGGGINQLTGDVTAGPGSGSQSATIASDAVTNAKLANVPTATFKGRNTAGTGDPEDLTATQATELLNLFTTSLKGLVPGPTTTNVSLKHALRADGVFSPEIFASHLRSDTGGLLSILSSIGIELGTEGGVQPKLTVTSQPGVDPYVQLTSSLGAILLGLGLTDEVSVGGFLDTADLASEPTPYSAYNAWFTLTADGFPRVKNSSIGTKKLWGNVKVLPLTISDMAVGLKLETLRIKTAIRILGWDIVGNASGSCVVDIVAAAGLPTVSDSIMGGSKPTLTAAQTNSATGLSIDVPADRYLRAEVESASGLATVTVLLHYRENE